MQSERIKPEIIIGFFILAFIVLFAGYGLRDPWPADEPRFVLVAKQMVESGDWLFPRRGIELYPDKPPLYFWLLALSYQLIGSWRWSFLLPSLLSGLLVLWLNYDLGKRLWNARAGLWAAVCVLVSMQFMYQFKRAQIDPTLVAMTSASLYLLIRHALLGPNWGLLYGGFFIAGLGVITKGVGFLPLLALPPLIVYRRLGFQPCYTPQRGDGRRWLLAIGLFFSAIALWLAPVLYLGLTSSNSEHQLYLQNILFKQTAERYANPWHHHEPFWYFAEVMAFFWLPFSLAFFWLITPWHKAWLSRDLRVIFPLVWAVLVVLFFSLSSGKRDMYILPALPAFALAAAPFMQGITDKKNVRRILWCFLMLMGSVLLALGLSALIGKAGFAQTLIEQRGLGAEVRYLWWMLLCSGALSMVLAVWAGLDKVLHAMAGSLLMLWLSYGFVVHPVLDGSSSARILMQKTREAAGPNTEIGLVAWKEQNLLQAQGPVHEFGFLRPETRQLADGIVWLNQQPKTRRLFINQLPSLSCVAYRAPDAIDLDKANRRSWWLVNQQALVHCDPETLRAKF